MLTGLKINLHQVIFVWSAEYCTVCMQWYQRQICLGWYQWIQDDPSQLYEKEPTLKLKAMLKAMIMYRYYRYVFYQICSLALQKTASWTEAVNLSTTTPAVVFSSGEGAVFTVCYLYPYSWTPWYGNTNMYTCTSNNFISPGSIQHTYEHAWCSMSHATRYPSMLSGHRHHEVRSMPTHGYQ